MKKIFAAVAFLSVALAICVIIAAVPALNADVPALFTVPAPTRTSTFTSAGTFTPAPRTSTPKVLAQTPAPLVATVTSTGLRVRSCAGLDCREVAWLRRGDRVRVERCQAGWAYLPQYGGWSKARYLAPNHCK